MYLDANFSVLVSSPLSFRCHRPDQSSSILTSCPSPSSVQVFLALMAITRVRMKKNVKEQACTMTAVTVSNLVLSSENLHDNLYKRLPPVSMACEQGATLLMNNNWSHQHRGTTQHWKAAARQTCWSPHLPCDKGHLYLHLAAKCLTKWGIRSHTWKGEWEGTSLSDLAKYWFITMHLHTDLRFSQHPAYLYYMSWGSWYTAVTHSVARGESQRTITSWSVGTNCKHGWGLFV